MTSLIDRNPRDPRVGSCQRVQVLGSRVSKREFRPQLYQLIVSGANAFNGCFHAGFRLEVYTS